MAKELETRRELVGQFEVPSGKVMIMDPDWIRLNPEIWKIDKTPKAITFWGQGAGKVAKMMEEDGYEVYRVRESEEEINEEEDFGNYEIKAEGLEELEKIHMTLNDYARVIEESVIAIPTPGENILDEIDFITSGDEMAGELGDAMAVVLNTYLCGGIYNVYATYRETRRNGEKIIKVEIDLAEDMS